MDYSVNSLMPVGGQSMWERVVVVDVDSKDWFDKGGEMVEFARLDLDFSEPLNVTPLAISYSIKTHVTKDLSGLFEDGQSGNQARMSFFSSRNLALFWRRR